jgi:DNA-binding LacI/PurR family transcriptional regulator
MVKQSSIKDLARLARVSHSTVSRALRGSPLVNPKTAELIRKVAQEAGYTPSAAARSLVTRRTQSIGVVVTDIADQFAACVVHGIEELATDCGFSVFLANSGADAEREMMVVRAFRERRVDGIVVTSSRVGALHVPELSKMEVPVVLLNNQHPSEFAHSVMIDNVGGSRALTRHLIDLGHRRIAYIGDRLGHQSDAERFAGFREAMVAAGLEIEDRYVEYGDGRSEGAGEPMRRLLDLAPLPTAVFCYNDMTALGALREIRARGLRVPDDISVTGFDDLPIIQYLDPPLTTVHQPMYEMGRMAMELLMELMAGAMRDHHTQVPGQLVVRGSTAPPKEKS